MSWYVRVVFALGALTLGLTAVTRLDPLQAGLAGEYFLSPDWRGAPVRTVDGAAASTEGLAAAWSPPAPQVFSARLTGGLLVLRGGTYTFATTSDDASFVYIDGVLVVNNGGAHRAEQQSGSATLDRGVHAILIDYNQQGGASVLELRWARGDAPLELVPAGRLVTRRVGIARFVASSTVWNVLAMLEWLWLAAALGLAGWFGAARLASLRRLLERAGTWRVLRWILLGSLILNAAGIWWGLPDNWPAAEVTPKQVLEGWERSFSHGWYDTYPPVHFYLLTATMGVVQALGWLGPLELSGGRDYALLYLSCRLVSLAFGAAIVVCTCLIGTRAFGRRPGLLAGAVFSLVAPFVYYAKTANTDVPYLFWFALSMVFYLRLLEGLRLRDFLWFAATATLAVCTKDQAYGLYLLMPLPIVYRIWRVNRQAAVGRPLLRALVDRRLWAAAGCAAVLFALSHNLVFNLEGFRAHVSYIVGPGSEDYQIFDDTLAGHVALLRLTAWLIQQSFGWPFTAAALAGVAMASAARRWRPATVWLLVPAVSYYLAFIDVVLYNYDRFVLPICFVLAPFAGLAFDRLLAGQGRTRPVRAAAVACAFAYTTLYSATVDVLMIGDSRYDVERWLKVHAGGSDLVAYTFPLEYLPGLDDFNHDEIRSVEGLQERRPAFYVLNVDYARAEPADSPTGMLIAGLREGRVGYRQAAEFRSASPWPWLPGAHRDLVGARQERRVSTILRNVNPTIAVFTREAR